MFFLVHPVEEPSFNNHWMPEALAAKVRTNHLNFNLRISTTNVSLLLAVFDSRVTHVQFSFGLVIYSIITTAITNYYCVH